ncbi:MAG: sigma-70 factor domain-containing protein, partial [Streptosporangiaceae bacterium]
MTTHVDELIQRGRGQGHLSLPELRAAFDQARISPTEARSIIRELTEAGVQLGNEPSDSPAAKAAGGKADAALAEAVADEAAVAEDELAEGSQASEVPVSAVLAEAVQASAAPANGPADDELPKAPAPADAVIESSAEVDLDDQTSVMGDSVHTYLKSIGRTSLLTAEEEVNLAKRIEAGLYAEHKLENETGLSRQLRADLEAVAGDGRRAQAHKREAQLRRVVSGAQKYSDRGLSLLDVVQEGNL